MKVGRDEAEREDAIAESYGQFATYYDELMADMPYPQWIAFARRCWERQGISPQKIADLGCGTGTLTLALADLGYSMIGIDLSDDMLAVARAKEIARQRLHNAHEVVWLQQDMRELELGGAIDAVVSFCDCLNYLLEEEEVARAFSRVYNSLADGGSFLFDVHHPSQLAKYAEMQPFVRDEQEISYLWTCDYDENRCEIEHRLSIFARQNNGLYRRTDEVHIQRTYDQAALESLLAKAGFKDVEVYADFNLQPPSELTERLFFTARK